MFCLVSGAAASKNRCPIENLGIDLWKIFDNPKNKNQTTDVDYDKSFKENGDNHVK